MTRYLIRRTDTGDCWDAGSSYEPGREHWTHEHCGTRYDAVSLALMESMRFERFKFEVEIVPVEES
jgi:hypothetical protein